MEIQIMSGAKSIVKNTFPVLEMSCAACAVSVESTLKATAGVKNASVNYANQSALVEFDQSIVSPADLRKSVQSVGYDIVIDTDHADDIAEESRNKSYQQTKANALGAALLTIPVVVIGMFLMDVIPMEVANYISLVLTIPVVFYFGRTFFENAWKQALHLKSNMDTLVALSTGIAFLFSAFNALMPAFWHARGLHPAVYFESAAVVITFVLLGKVLEEKAKSGTSYALKKLLGLQPKHVLVVRDGKDQSITLSEVIVDDILIVKPGEKIAVDGDVVAGQSYVDESMISGEPVAVKKANGDKVFAGTINQKGALRVRALKVGSDTVLATIIQRVKEAQASKAPVQKLVDRIAGIFVPAVLVIAVITFGAWMTFGEVQAFAHALMASVTVLVIACPCALGLATPTAIMVGIGRGAENNILIKDAESLERAYQADVVVLDKTGTITKGTPAVIDQYWSQHADIASAKSVLLALESGSEHPLAEAVVNQLKQEKTGSAVVSDFESVTARGVKGRSEDELYFVGNENFMKENAVIIPEFFIEKIRLWQNESKTVILFGNSKAVIGVLSIADEIKHSSKEAIKRLRDHGIAVHMLTGDQYSSAAAVAASTGIVHFRSEVLPSDKEAYVKQLQSEGKIVAMVGDGINDAQALAQADVSIAMGKGTDVAMDVAKITLISSDLSGVAKALQLSRKTIRTIRQNLFWAFVYNVIGIPVAAGVLYPLNGFLLSPMIAGAAMALSSLSVVLNSIRLRFTKID